MNNKKIAILALFSFCLVSSVKAIRVSFYVTNHKNERIITIDTEKNTHEMKTSSGISVTSKIREIVAVGEGAIVYFEPGEFSLSTSAETVPIEYGCFNGRVAGLPANICYKKNILSEFWFQYDPKNVVAFEQSLARLVKELKRTGRTSGNSSSRPSANKKNNSQQSRQNSGRYENSESRTVPKASSRETLLNNELPYRLEVPDGLKLNVDDASKGEYSGYATHEGGLVGVILHTKSGRYPEEARLPRYKAEIVPMNGQTADWLSIVSTKANLLAIQIDRNYSSRSRGANIYLKIDGEVYGRLFVFQLAEGAVMN